MLMKQKIVRSILVLSVIGGVILVSCQSASTANGPEITQEVEAPIPTPTATPDIDPSKISFSGAGAHELANIDGGGPVFSTAFAPDNSLLAMAGYGQITLWNLKTLTREHSLEGHTDLVWDLAWTPDGGILASASQDGTVILWETETYKQVALLETGPASSLDFSPDGSQLVIGTGAGEVQLWDVADVELMDTLVSSTSSPVNSVDWSPNGAVIASGVFSGQIYIWDADTGDIIKILEGYGAELSSANDVDWSPDGGLLASGHEDGKVHLWDANTWGLVNTIDAHNSRVSSVAWMPYGNVLASGGGDHSASIWDVGTGLKVTGGGADSDIYSLDWSPNGKFLAAGSAGRLTVPPLAALFGGDGDTVRFNEGAGNCLLFIRKDNQ
jgi:WD40 repeat protein